jgi:SOS-response transcriptional repressor LexA
LGPRFVTKIENNRIYVVAARDGVIRAENLVVVDQDTSPRIGDLVMMAIESGWGIRKLIKSNGKVYLESDTERLGVREEYLVAGKIVMVVTGV